MELKDKTTIVTGSGKGIGEGIAVVLARQGANVVVNALRRAYDSSGEKAQLYGQNNTERGGYPA